MASTLPVLAVVLRDALRQHRFRTRATPVERRAWYHDWLITTGDVAPELRMFSLGGYFKSAYQKLRQQLRGERFDLTRRQGGSQLFAGLSALAVTAAAMLWMVSRTLAGLTSLGDLALFYQAFQQGLSLARELLEHVGQLYQNSLVARALHSNSARSNGPFVAVNCAALPDSLLESELFGHERGAFTHAVSRQRGKFELADGGTLFLDEVGELSSAAQAKLLRAIESRTIDRIGGTGPVSINVRFIAATNRDLAQEVPAGAFREDLYYRLKVLSVRTPPLRERREDIPALAQHFIMKHAARAGRAVYGVAPEAEAVLMAYHWPGNIRQLQNVIEHAVVMGSGSAVLKGDLPDELLVQASAPPPTTYGEALHEFKRQLFQHAFDRANGNYREVALMLGLHAKSIHRHVRNLNLTVAGGRKP